MFNARTCSGVLRTVTRFVAAGSCRGRCGREWCGRSSTSSSEAGEKDGGLALWAVAEAEGARKVRVLFGIVDGSWAYVGRRVVDSAVVVAAAGRRSMLVVV
jgi:hypothetical protein